MFVFHNKLFKVKEQLKSAISARKFVSNQKASYTKRKFCIFSVGNFIRLCFNSLLWAFSEKPMYIWAGLVRTLNV